MPNGASRLKGFSRNLQCRYMLNYSVNGAAADDFKAAGITRLSLGVQVAV